MSAKDGGGGVVEGSSIHRASVSAPPGRSFRTRSALAVIRASVSRVARASSTGTTRRGRQPSERATSRLERTYQPTVRRTRPKSSISVLTSITRSAPSDARYASTSIHPRNRPSPISTSVRTSQPRCLSCRTTYPLHRAWIRSCCSRRPANPIGFASTVSRIPSRSSAAVANRMSRWSCVPASRRWTAA